MTLTGTVAERIGNTTPSGARSGFVAVNDLVLHYPLSRSKAIRAVDGVSFEIPKGQVLGLVGESGCGKSTIAKVLMRLVDPTSGTMVIDDLDMSRLRGEELRRLRPRMQMVFQDPLAALDPRMKIGVSMGSPLLQHGMAVADEARQQVLRMLGDVGLDPSFYDRYPHQCSGGQLQRIIIGRALLLRPSFLVCDEPTSALDASVRTQILNLLADLKDRFSLTLLMISHDLRVVRHLCDRVAVMYLGRIVEMAGTADLFRAPKHPYTRALIAASMIESESGFEAPSKVRGEPPSPLNPPKGCHFHPRCAHAADVCRSVRPELEVAGPRSTVRCHRWREIQLS